MEERRFNAVPILSVLLLLAAYLGVYFALVTPESHTLVPDRDDPNSFIFTHYRYGSVYAEFVFWPIEQLDRRCRDWYDFSDNPFG